MAVSSPLGGRPPAALCRRLKKKDLEPKRHFGIHRPCVVLAHVSLHNIRAQRQVIQDVDLRTYDYLKYFANEASSKALTVVGPVRVFWWYDVFVILFTLIRVGGWCRQIGAIYRSW